MILARNSVTLSWVRDIASTWRYYKLQSSTASKPSKPTAYPPSGWQTSEPSYTSGSTNSLYTVECTVYVDGTFDYSEVSLSSSYEAAKEAYNKANAAKNTADTAHALASQVAECINGTQTTNTYNWTGTSSTITELTDGLSIVYWLPRSVGGNGVGATYTTVSSGAKTTVTGAVLNLTLADGSTTGNIPIWYMGVSRLTSHFSYGSSIHMVYHKNVTVAGSYFIERGWWVDAQYNSDTLDNRIPYFAGKTGSKGIWAAGLFMRDGNGAYQTICTASDGTATSSNRTAANTKKANTSGFEVGSPIWYTNTSYNANTNISGYGVVYSAYSLFDSRYALNTTLTANSLTTYKPVYLVGTIHSSDGLFYLDTMWWTQTPTDTSKVYVLIGGCYDSTTSNCRIGLYEANAWLKYDGSKLVDYTGKLAALAQSTADTAKTTATTAKSTADTAKSTADTAKSTADTAKSTATTAQSTANAAQSTANTAKSTADTAKSTADAAKTAAANAQTAANSKNAVFYQTSAPTGTHKVNDIWFDTGNGNAMYAWDGTQWAQHQFGTVSIADGTVTADKLTAWDVIAQNVLAQDITATGTITGAKLIGGSDSMIGPWSLSNSAIYKGNPSFGQENGIYFGNDGFSIGNVFKVNSNGMLTGKSVELSGSIKNYIEKDGTNVLVNRISRDGIWVRTSPVIENTAYIDLEPDIFGGMAISDSEENSANAVVLQPGRIVVGSREHSLSVVSNCIEINRNRIRLYGESVFDILFELSSTNKILDAQKLTIKGKNIIENGTALSDKYAAKSHNHDSSYAAKNHDHSLIKDSANGVNTIFAYSKAHVEYANYTWLAGWISNGSSYELRAIAKSDFAKANHTHAYLSTSGGAVNGNIGLEGNYNTANRSIYCNWKDGNHHDLLVRSSDGLNASVGWAGSSSYATVLNLRGRTVKVINSSGTTNISDERLKKNWISLDKYNDFFDTIDPKAFQYINGSSGRYHLGFSAQAIERALADSGLSNQDFGGIVKQSVDSDSEDYHGYDEEYGLIYTEFIALTIDQVQKLKARVNELEHEVDEMQKLKAKLDAQDKVIETLLGRLEALERSNEE